MGLSQPPGSEFDRGLNRSIAQIFDSILNLTLETLLLKHFLQYQTLLFTEKRGNGDNSDFPLLR